MDSICKNILDFLLPFQVIKSLMLRSLLYNPSRRLTEKEDFPLNEKFILLQGAVFAWMFPLDVSHMFPKLQSRLPRLLTKILRH